MRMKNPFSDEPGDEESEAAETSAGQTRESEQPDDQPEDQPEANEARADEEPADDEPADEDSDSPAAESDPDDDSGDGTRKEKAGITAPSIGPDTVIEREPPEERLDFDKISDQDAMGEDKRREVVGKSYGPSRTRVLATFAGFIAVVAALTIGFYFLAKELDQPPAENPDEAPWSQADAPQTPPRPLQ